MRGHWDAHKSVAHLIAALMCFRVDLPLYEKEIFAAIMEEPNLLFQSAKALQDFILKKNLVLSNTLWHLPEITKTWKTDVLPLEPLPMAAQDVLAKYKAASHDDN